jgi:hypothetical protein
LDEYPHPAGPESNFNEAVYGNFYDPSTRVGGLLRLGNRVHESHAEMTVCLFLPDGRVAFMFRRPHIATNEAFDAGGLRFEIIRPLEELNVSYQGEVVVLDDPLVMAEPKRAFSENPRADCSVDLTLTGVSTMFGGEPEDDKNSGQFARAHYEQLISAFGAIEIGTGDVATEHWDVEGYGLRDHSWGPRSWQAPWYYRWLTANFGPTFGFMGRSWVVEHGEGRRDGFVWDGTAMHLCDDFSVSTTWTGVNRYHDTIDATLHAAEKEWHVRGKVLSLLPLRNRRDSLVTRISEGMTEWRLDDGRIGYGISEYLDQIIDGQPVGLAE